MPINFFKQICKTESSEINFGICDNLKNKGAYIDENNKSNWISIVSNPDQKEIEFYAIDNCVEIRRANGEMESRCDGVLKESSNLIFVELKQRESGNWFKKGREQLTITINIFKIYYNADSSTSIRAFVCNSLRPRAHSGRAVNIEKFFDDTGYILKDQQEIEF